MSEFEVQRSNWPSEFLILYLAFAATGIGVALPGILLPALMRDWNLKDGQAGLLFLVAWCGSSLGALLVRGSLRITLAAGGFLIAVGAIGLATLPGKHFPWLMACYGLGLGITMTTISILRKRQAQRVEVEMVRLNLLWALGACACPSLAIRALRSGNTHPLLISIGAFFLAAALWSVFFLREHPVAHRNHNSEGERTSGAGSWATLLRVPVPLLMMLFLVTGIEASAGAWLTTYAQRARQDLALTIAAPTCLWAGLLLSRSLWSLPGQRFHASRVVQGSLAVLSASAILLVLSGGGITVLVAAFGVGFSLGPVYPLLLANALSYQETGTLFFIAGLGSASLPWLTGVLSQSRSSLKDGLLVPMTAAILMFFLSLGFFRKTRHDKQARIMAEANLPV
jgi:FHS family glucose/mannose:H+ symporter-like MFS transporter